jgi:hypothetical protein
LAEDTLYAVGRLAAYACGLAMLPKTDAEKKQELKIQCQAKLKN